MMQFPTRPDSRRPSRPVGAQLASARLMGCRRCSTPERVQLWAGSGRARQGSYVRLPAVSVDAGYTDDPPKRVGFFTDTSVGIGYKACEVACKQWNTLPVRGHRPAQG